MHARLPTVWHSAKCAVKKAADPWIYFVAFRPLSAYAGEMRFGSLAVGVVLLLGAAPARGDVTHVVQKGETLAAIARRYHTSAHAIAQANQLKGGRPSPGQTLTIPRVGASDAGGQRIDTGVIRATRDGETIRVRVRDPHGRITESALKAFQNLMREGLASFPVDPRLLALITVVSDHFGGRTLDVVSGYRTYTPSQVTPHSNHNLGKALDFKIEGVKNEDIWSFCRTFRGAGCGYYPNSGFVHLDVRETKAWWIDRSLPGEPPQYDPPEALAVRNPEIPPPR